MGRLHPEAPALKEADAAVWRLSARFTSVKSAVTDREALIELKDERSVLAPVGFVTEQPD